jgi:hypothetical protein
MKFNVDNDMNDKLRDMLWAKGCVLRVRIGVAGLKQGIRKRYRALHEMETRCGVRIHSREVLK